MIVIEYDKFTIECSNLEELLKQIKIQNIPLQEATIKIRVKIPGIAFEEIVKDIKGSGGRIL